MGQRLRCPGCSGQARGTDDLFHYAPSLLVIRSDVPKGKGHCMSKSVLYMSMSLDGYIAGPTRQPRRRQLHALHEWYGFASDAAPTAETVDASGTGSQFLDEIKETGAVPAGRNTVEQVDHWGGDHHDGVPIFVPSHRPPGPSVVNYPLVTYVADGIADAMDRVGARPSDRHPGSHPHPIPHRLLTFRHMHHAHCSGMRQLNLGSTH